MMNCQAMICLLCLNVKPSGKRPRQLWPVSSRYFRLNGTAALILPTLNAAIIDNGVLAGDNAYIRRTGAIMIGFSIAQIVFAIGAVWYGARAAMAFGRDIRRDLFDKVTAFSAREVGQFGAPSLITRVTNDVQQVQMLVVMTTTMMIAAPLTMVIGFVMAMREDAGLSVVLLVSMPLVVLFLGPLVRMMVPSFPSNPTTAEAATTL